MSKTLFGVLVMSKNLSEAAVASFDNLVKDAYRQDEGTLRKTVCRRVNAKLNNCKAPEYTDLFDQAETNNDKLREPAQTIVAKIVRREDQLIIDALDAATTSLTVGVNVGGVNSGMTTAKAKEAQRLMDDANVPKMDRFMVVHSNGLSQLLDDPTATSADCNTIRALVQGDIDTWLGFKWIALGDYDEGGLNLTGNVRTNFAYHKKAVGGVFGVDLRTEVNYIPVKTSWLANALFSAGAEAIDPNGIVEISTHENF